MPGSEEGMIELSPPPDALAEATHPHLRLRAPVEGLLVLPWALPLAQWRLDQGLFKTLPVGPSRHLVRFVELGSTLYALKEEPLAIAIREYTLLREFEELALPAVVAVGLAEAPERGTGILVTLYLPHSLQYRRLLMRVPTGPSAYRDRLLDAMASLLVDLHRAGVYWGDCSLANTLFRRDGNRIQAYLVDAETSEVHPSLSVGQRRLDLDVLVENVAFGLADLAAYQNRMADLDDPIVAAESVRRRYSQLWDELHHEEELRPGDRHAVTARLRKLNELGFAVDEIELVPGGPEGRLRLRVAVADRRFHARELARRTGIVALEDQARLLLNDLREYRAWLAWFERREVSREDAAERWKSEVLEPSLARLAAVIGPERDPLQAYCDVLEHKWILSEGARRDVGLDAAIRSYIELGAPAPEAGGIGPDVEAGFDGGPSPPRPSPETPELDSR